MERGGNQLEKVNGLRELTRVKERGPSENWKGGGEGFRKNIDISIEREKFFRKTRGKKEGPKGGKSGSGGGLFYLGGQAKV